MKNPNVPVASGSTATALHVASEIGRADAGMNKGTGLLLLTIQCDYCYFILKSTIPYGMSREEHLWNALGTPRSRLSLKVGHLTNSMYSQLGLTFSDSRTALQLQYRALLGSYVSSPLSSPAESSEMISFLEGPR